MDVPCVTCRHCQGMGLNRGALRQVVKANESERLIDKPGTIDLNLSLGVDCGRCQHRMQGVSAGTQALIDRCTHCGFIWIDKGELPAIVDTVRRHMRGHTPPDNLDELLHNPEAMRRAGEKASRALNGPPVASNQTMSTVDAIVELLWWLPWI